MTISRFLSIIFVFSVVFLGGPFVYAQQASTTPDISPTYSLDLSADEITAGESITVTWETNASDVSLDWVALYEAGAGSRQYLEWEYVETAEGSFSVSVADPGTYEFRYNLDNQYEEAARSESFTVVPAEEDEDEGTDPPTYSLDLSADEITAGESITVTWETNASDVSLDWVALYEAGAGSRQYLEWEYVETAEGSFSVSVADPGTYEFRYNLDNQYEEAARSESFTVVPAEEDEDEGTDPPTYSLDLSADEITAGESITVTWETNASDVSLDWVALYEAGAGSRQYLEWEYVETAEGSFSVSVADPGTYEFRYNLDNQYEEAARSESFTVVPAEEDEDEGTDPPTYSLDLSADEITAGESITVTWETNASDVSLDWVALYEAGAGSRQYLEWEYVETAEGSFSVSVADPGTYEFRYNLDNQYEEAARSESFTVVPAEGGEATSYSVEPTRSTYNLGEEAEVVWTAPRGDVTFLDWIGLYRPNTSDRAYLEYEYVDRLSNIETLELTQEGTFEFRYFKNNSYRKVATSEPITVGDVTSACTYNTSSITNFPPPTGPIVALGDSITFGIGASPGENYVEELEDRLDIDIVNAGVPADTTRDALVRLESDVLARNPSTVIVFIGGNDELRRVYESLSDSAADRALEDELDGIVSDRLGLNWRQVELIPRAETFENIHTIIDRIQATGAATIVVGFDATIYNADIDDAYRTIASNTGSFFVPNIYNGIFGRPSRMSDLIHPNDVGYDIIADRIQPAVKCVL